MATPTRSAFTLIELIVVMAIIVTLSVIGFISYNSYVRDSRNAAREAHLNDIVKTIDQFIFTKGVAPKCNAGATSGVCYFTNHTGYTASKAKGTTTVPAQGILPADWSSLNFKKGPEDPRGVYFLYAYNGPKYAVFATKELENGYAAILKGHAAMEEVATEAGPIPPATTCSLPCQTNQGDTNVIASATLGLGVTVEGETVISGIIQPASPLAIKYNNFFSTTASAATTGNAAIPYSW